MAAYIVGDGPRDSGPPPNLTAHEDFEDARADVIGRIEECADNTAMGRDSEDETAKLDALIPDVRDWTTSAPLDGHGHWFANADLDGCPWHFWIIFDPTVNAEEYNEFD